MTRKNQRNRTGEHSSKAAQLNCSGSTAGHYCVTSGHATGMPWEGRCKV